MCGWGLSLTPRSAVFCAQLVEAVSQHLHIVVAGAVRAAPAHVDLEVPAAERAVVVPDPRRVIVDRLLAQLRRDEVDRPPVHLSPVRDGDERDAVVVQHLLEVGLALGEVLVRLAVQLQAREPEVADELDLLLVDRSRTRRRGPSRPRSGVARPREGSEARCSSLAGYCGRIARPPTGRPATIR